MLISMICILNLTIIGEASGQETKEADSLELLLNTELDDSLKVPVLYKLISYYSSRDSSHTATYLRELEKLSSDSFYPDLLVESRLKYGRMLLDMGYHEEARHIFTSTRELAMKIDSVRLEVKAILLLTILNQKISNRKEANYYAELYLGKAQMLGDSTLISKAYINKGGLWQVGDDVRLPLENYEKSLEIDQQMGDYENMVWTYLRMGNIYLYLGETVEAIDQYFKGLKISETHGLTEYEVMCYSNLGYAYQNQREFSLALQYLEKGKITAQKLYESDPTRANLTPFCINLWNQGELYRDLQQYDQSFSYLYEALELSKKLKNDEYLGMAWSRIGNLQVLSDSLVAARTSLSRAQKLLENTTNKEELSLTLFYQSQLAEKQGHTDRAIKYLKRCMNVAMEIEYLPIIRNSAYDLFRIYQRNGDFERALNYHILFKEMSDSIQDEEKTKKITQQAMQFEFDKYRREQQTLQKEKDFEATQQVQQQKAFRNTFLIIALALVIVTFLIYRAYQIKRKANLEINKYLDTLEEKSEEISSINLNLNIQKEHLEKTVATKDMFFSIIGHDLRNPLSSFVEGSNILLHESISADEQKLLLELMNNSANQAYNLLENLLQWAQSQTGNISFRPTQIDLHGLVYRVFGQVENHASSKKIELITNVTSPFEVICDWNMMETVLRNLVTNAIKYSYQESKVEVLVEQNKQSVTITIKDHGIGMTPSQMDVLYEMSHKRSTPGTNSEKGSGLGLILTKDFVEMHTGTIEVQSKVNHGSTFTITLPQQPGSNS